MPYRRFEEQAAIAAALEEGFEWSPYDAAQAAQVIQELVDEHRGGGDLADQLEAARNRYTALYQAVLRWSEATDRAKADALLEEEAGITFPLTVTE